MRTSFLLAFGVAALVAAGCSSTPTRVNSGTIKARTFSFVSTAGRPQPDYADQTAQIHKLVQAAITADLSRRGLTGVSTGGDITVAYLIIAGNNATTTSINDYFGYGRDVSALDEIAHDKYSDSKNPNYFEAGTLLIDFIDSKTNKLLKRNYATRALLTNPTPAQQAERMQEVVAEILNGTKFEN
jgi:Domain of unknown function (DUF4136)